MKKEEKKQELLLRRAATRALLASYGEDPLFYRLPDGTYRYESVPIPGMPPSDPASAAVYCDAIFASEQALYQRCCRQVMAAVPEAQEQTVMDLLRRMVHICLPAQPEGRGLRAGNQEWSQALVQNSDLSGNAP